MAAGVGKTYRMLQEGQAEAEAGRDVVIGYLEPHGRAETIAQAAGLEVSRAAGSATAARVLEEMDLPAILARAPELCLIDELAHTNAPGVEHEKRYEDIEDVLAAGIDVFSTVNVQHLESLNDQVAELTGIRVRETVPDAVLALGRRGRADRHHAGVADRAAARGQDLPARARPGGAQQLLQDREPRRRCARSRCARSPRRSRPSGSRPTRRPARPREDRLIDARRAAGDRRAPARARHAAARTRSASCAAPGARRSGSAPSSTCCGSPTSEPTDEEQRAARRAAPARERARRAPAGRARRRRRARRPAGRPRARHDLRADGHRRSPRGALRAAATPALPLRLLRAAARASTCGSSPTAPSGRGSERMTAVLIAARGGRAGRRAGASRSWPARRRARPAPTRTAAATAHRRILFPFVAQRALAPRARRGAAARARRGRHARAGVPRARAAAPAARRPAAAPVRDRAPAAGGDRAARGRVRRAGRRADRARAHATATRCARRSRTSASTGS